MSLLMQAGYGTVQGRTDASVGFFFFGHVSNIGGQINSFVL